MNDMYKCMNAISTKYPCRNQQVKQLYKLIGYKNENLPNAIILYGDHGTGKTTILMKICKYIKGNINASLKYIHINLIECYTVKIFFEKILNLLMNHEPIKLNNYRSYKKCENLLTFIDALQELNNNNQFNEIDNFPFAYVIIFDNAEEFIKMDSNIVSCLIRLQELSGMNITCVFISTQSFDSFYQLQIGIYSNTIIKCYFQQYKKNEIHEILLKHFIKILKQLQSKCKLKYLDNNNLLMVNYEENLKFINQNVYQNYLDLCLNVFYRNCRNLNELKIICNNHFIIYCEPILNGSTQSTNITKLYQQFSQSLKTILATIFTIADNTLTLAPENSTKTTTLAINKQLDVLLELPFYAKYLLISAFIASHNPSKSDKRLFVKNHGKQRKRVQSVKSKAVVSEKYLTQLGPKSFSIDRLLAIFYAIIDEKVGLTCNLLAQISSLVYLKFLTYTSGENSIMDGSAKLQCTISLEFITEIGRIVGFNVHKYLYDFM